ncbi:MAG: hypothetical protein AAB908_01120, partial [Patescibacteria group bacterium]
MKRRLVAPGTIFNSLIHSPYQQEYQSGNSPAIKTLEVEFILKSPNDAGKAQRGCKTWPSGP